MGTAISCAAVRRSKAINPNTICFDVRPLAVPYDPYHGLISPYLIFGRSRRVEMSTLMRRRI